MRVLSFLLMFIASLSASADTLQSAAQTKAVTDEIMQHFVKEEFVKGIEIAKKYWLTSPQELDALAQRIGENWPVVRDNYGTPVDYEFVRVDRLGSSFVRLYFLQKFEANAIQWKFTFYKPKDGWAITDLSYQGDIEMLFETVK
jgi:hypothetical protein